MPITNRRHEKKRPDDVFKMEPPWPAMLGAAFARTAGIVLIVVLTIIIVISYCLFCREGKHGGHLNSSNKKARKTIIIHAFALSATSDNSCWKTP